MNIDYLSIYLDLWFLSFTSVQFSHSVKFNSLRPHGLQHARLPCPSPSPGVCSNSSSQWYHPIISSSVVPFSSCYQSFPASGSFPMRQVFTSGGQSIGALALASVLPMKIQVWQAWSPCCPMDFQESSPEPQFKNTGSSALSLLYGPTITFIHDYWKNHSFEYMDCGWQHDVSAF